TVLARAVEPDGRSLGLTAFLVDGSAPGLKIGPESLTLGVRAIVQNRVFLEGVSVPAGRVLGVVGNGLAVAQDAMNLSRLGVAALSLGVMKRCAQLWLRYSARRLVATGKQLDQPITLSRLDDLTSAIAATGALVSALAERLDDAVEVPSEL